MELVVAFPTALCYLWTKRHHDLRWLRLTPGNPLDDAASSCVIHIEARVYSLEI